MHLAIEPPAFVAAGAFAPGAAAVPYQLWVAGVALALPFLGAVAIAVLRVARRTRALSAAIAILCSSASAALIVLLRLRFEPFEWRVEWIPTAGVSFGLLVDELSLLFALLAAGIGCLTVWYSAFYVARTREGRGRTGDIGAYHAYLLLFLGATLGIAFSGDLLQLYLFWELLDIAGFLLIGLNWRSASVRRGAVSVLLFTALGGFALLLAVAMLGSAAGTFWVPELLERGELLRASSLYLPSLLLVTFAAAVKSAQVPLHVWLPRAMAAPTPVNAFEDSAAVLAAGVFLLARLHPLFAGDPVWFIALVTVGVASMLIGGALALAATHIKVLLAYSTVSQFGFMFVLMGVGTPGTFAVALLFLLQHGLIKAGLFFIVGVVGLRAGAWVLGDAPALWRRLPITFVAACVLALSLAGVPPAAGFWMKEAYFEHLLEGGELLIVGISVAGAALTLAYMLRWLIGIFFGRGSEVSLAPQSSSTSIALTAGVPIILAGSTLLLGFWPSLVTDRIVTPAAALLVTGADAAISLELHLGPPLALSGAALVLGAVGYFLLPGLLSRIRGVANRLSLAESAYGGIASVLRWAGRGTLRLQNGALLRYTFLTVLSLVGLVAVAAFPTEERRTLLRVPALGDGGIDPGMIILLLLICAGTLLTFTLRKHLQIVLMLGAVGYLIAGVFALSLAPNLGLLQVHVETLVTVLLILPLAAIPRELREGFFVGSVERVTPERLGLAVVTGAGAAWVSWHAIEHLPTAPIAERYVQGFPGAVEATDLVAAVLIHYRALDTLGEIIVFATAAIAVLVFSGLIREERR